MTIFDIDPELMMAQRESAQLAFDQARGNFVYSFFLHNDGSVLFSNPFSRTILDDATAPSSTDSRRAFVASFIAIALEAQHPHEINTNDYGTQYKLRIAEGTQPATRPLNMPVPKKDRARPRAFARR